MAPLSRWFGADAQILWRQRPAWLASGVQFAGVWQALLISAGHADSLGGVYLRSITSGSRFDALHLTLRHVIAVLCQTMIENDRTIHTACDLYADTGAPFEPVKGYSEAYEVLEARRSVRWEDEMDRLIDAGTVTRELLESQLPHQRAVLRYLNQQRSETLG